MLMPLYIIRPQRLKWIWVMIVCPPLFCIPPPQSPDISFISRLDCAQNVSGLSKHFQRSYFKSINWRAKYVRYSQETQIVGLNVITSLWKAFFDEKQRSVSCNLINDAGSSLESSFPDGILTSVQNSPLYGHWGETGNKPGSRTQLSLTRLMMHSITLGVFGSPLGATPQINRFHSRWYPK